MVAQSGAPVSAVVQLQASVTREDVIEALAAWLQKAHAVDLESTKRDGLMVEWRLSDDEPLACQLVASDSTDSARRTITVACDEAGAIAFIDETPFSAIDGPHAQVDLSRPLQLLLSCMTPLASTVLDLPRGEIANLATVGGFELISGLSQVLAPGLLIAVTPLSGQTTLPQQELLEDLAALTLVGSVPIGSELLGELGVTAQARSGCVVCVSRSTDGLDARVIASTSLRTKPDSARRLIVRRQLAAPMPFDVERRRSSAVSRLLAGGSEIDLPSALQLLDEETQRASDLNNRVKELELALELAYEEQDSALGDLDNAQSQVRYLQKAFKALGEVPLVEAEDDDDWQPDSCVDALVAAREALPYLIIGATDEGCSALDNHQKRGIWAKKIWNSLRALNDYCRAVAEGRFSGDISMYRDDTPLGAIPLLAEYAANESKSTNDDADLVKVRTFTVPSAVNPSGRAYMQQHVKIDKGGQSAPRIHLLDGAKGSTERIYIGYIGPHLPTSTKF